MALAFVNFVLSNPTLSDRRRAADHRATDPMLTHWLKGMPRCSSTMRTAAWRTLGERGFIPDTGRQRRSAALSPSFERLSLSLI